MDLSSQPAIKAQMKHVPAKPERLSSMASLISTYDTFIFDLWGVTHNGGQVLKGAQGIFSRIKSAGKKLYFLSNAPRRSHDTAVQLEVRGLSQSAYDGLFTSGEACHEHLKNRAHPFYQNLGNTFYHLGPLKDTSLYGGLEYMRVEDIAHASFILNTGPLTFCNAIDDYNEILRKGAQLKLPMICPNPDLVVMHQGEKALCAGALAKVYEDMGGDVMYHGKPDAKIFEALCKKFCISKTPKDLNRILMIGDSLRTDIQGAENFGIHSVFIETGIHTKDLESDTVEALCQRYNTYPTYTLSCVQ